MVSYRYFVNSSAWRPTRNEWLKAILSVQREERERIDRFMFQRDAKFALIGRLLIRFIVSEALHIPWKEIELSRSEKGKPFLVNSGHSGFQFNVSHSGDVVVLAAETDCTMCGVDTMKIECKESVETFFGHMNRQFTAHEWQQIRANAVSDQLARFYRFWCLKESLVKAIGTGITFELKRIDFTTASPLSQSQAVLDSQVSIDGCRDEQWRFEESLLDANHMVAVALQGRPNCAHNLFSEMSISTLLARAVSLDEHEEKWWRNFVTKPEKP